LIEFALDSFRAFELFAESNLPANVTPGWRRQKRQNLRVAEDIIIASVTVNLIDPAISPFELVHSRHIGDRAEYGHV
jgi:hypothetical protein